MNCPVCKERVLSVNNIEANLAALECRGCQGRWIQSYQYWKWREAQGDDLVEQPLSEGAELDVDDSTMAKLCPECGHILIRHPVGHGISFKLDRCGNCGGVWFDRNEWESLKAQNLHDDVHLIFSTVWQKEVRQAEHEQALEEFYLDKFGPMDFEKAKEIKEWIDNHPLSSELRAFIMDQQGS